jgi:hypothetical protein
VLIDFKNNFYPDTVQKIADEAVRGNSPPLLPSARNQSLPTSYFHHLLTDPAGLLASLDLKLPVTLAPLRLLEEGEEAYYLTLAVYRDDNDPCGARAEWWTYASDEEGAYYSLRLLSQSMDACIDPVALLGLPALVDARVENENYRLQLVSTSVQVSAELQTQLQTSVLPSQDWIECGARICALNGICDDYFYDGQTLVAPVKAIDTSGATIEQWTTPWDDFIEAFPAAVWLRDKSQPLAVNPWQESL